jgi:hypothetical protein
MSEKQVTRIQFYSVGPDGAEHRGRWHPPSKTAEMETEAEELNQKLGSQGWSYKVKYDNSKPYDEVRAKQGYMDD